MNSTKSCSSNATSRTLAIDEDKLNTTKEMKMNVQTFLNGALKFSVGSELESYRVSTLFSKEPETIAWIDSWEVNENASFFDVGANIGIYSFYAAAKHPQLSVCSFEPEQNNYSTLCSNALLNPNIKLNLFRLALSDTEGIIDLHVDDLRVGNSNSQILPNSADSSNMFVALRIERVLRVSLDFLIGQLNFPSPAYLKVDVDGHENSILQGAKKLFSSDSFKSLLVEFNNSSDFIFWKDELEKSDLFLDGSYDQVPGHSNFRRAEKGSVMRNVIFSKSPMK